MYYEIKIGRTVSKGGKVKRINETYVVVGKNFSQVEEDMRMHAKSLGLKNMVIKSMKVVTFYDVFANGDGINFFDVTITSVSFGRNLREIKKKHMLLVNAANLENAKKVVSDGMKNSMLDYHISSIKESKVKDLLSLNKSSE